MLLSSTGSREYEPGSEGGREEGREGGREGGRNEMVLGSAGTKT